MPKTTVLYIDGQNFFKQLPTILKRHKVEFDKFLQLPWFDFGKLFGETFTDYEIDKTKYFTASITEYVQAARDPVHKVALEARNRILRSNIEKRGYIWREPGMLVPGRKSKVCNNCQQPLSLCGRCSNLSLFEEKGVDAGLVMDLVLDANNGDLGTALVLSSDTDMMPAMRFAMRRGVKVVHVGFRKPLHAYYLRRPYVCEEVVELDNDLLVKAFKLGSEAGGFRTGESGADH